MKEFNVLGLCVPGVDYMADTSGKIAAITAMVEKRQYFTINCPRQYGKTTTLCLLERALSKEYLPISISFEGADDNMFESSESFCKKFVERCADALGRQGSPEAENWKSGAVGDFDSLHKFLTEICRNKKYVLLVDEVDKSSDNNIFLKFLGMLRDKYLLRKAGKDDSFHSVILAGVHNIKNLKIKMEQAGYIQRKPGEAGENSPWNIAADFEVDMSLSVNEIASMLADYEADHNTGMDIETMAAEIRAYTSGYPYLVSRICMIIENKLNKDWTPNGVALAIRLMLKEKSTPLHDDIYKNLNNNKELDDLIFGIVAKGERYTYGGGIRAMELGFAYGLLAEHNNRIVIGNKFFELLLHMHYALKLDIEKNICQRTSPSEVISDGKFDMPLAIEKFVWHYYELYNERRIPFLEDQCQMLFITFIRAMINGGGHYFVESETRDAKRTDVVVTYADEQFIIELKIWRGETKHEQALDQLAGYLSCKNNDTGYLLTFDFRKVDNSGEPKMAWVEYGGKKIFDVMVGR